MSLKYFVELVEDVVVVIFDSIRKKLDWEGEFLYWLGGDGWDLGGGVVRLIVVV